MYLKIKKLINMASINCRKNKKLYKNLSNHALLFASMINLIFITIIM